MTWAYDGDWSDLNGATIAEILADLCNAVNERRDCLGVTRVSWTVNTGSELAPTVGAKSADLEATDFHGLDLLARDYYTPILTEILALLRPGSPYSLASRHSGFAKTSTNTGLSSEGDLWTLESIATDCGIAQPSGPATIFEKDVADYLREALDRMIYPVVHPSITPGTRGGWYGTNVGELGPFTSAADAWGGMVSSPAQGFLTGDCGADVTYSPFTNHYAAHLGKFRSIEFSNRDNQSATGYSGVATKQWAKLEGGGLHCSGLNVALLGGATEVSSPGSYDFGTTSMVPLDGEISDDVSLIDTPSVALPFTGPASGNIYGTLYVTVYDIRQILDISGELTDQQP